MSETTLIKHMYTRGCAQIFRVPPCGGAMEVKGLGSLVFNGWPSALVPLWILVQRAHPDWTASQVSACLRDDLGL